MSAARVDNPPPAVLRLATERAAERGLTLADLEDGGFTFAHRDGHGWCMVASYGFADGSSVERRLVLRLPKSAGNWRWAAGSEPKGSVLELGDPYRARIVVVCEGESDSLRAWRVFKSFPAGEVAVIGIAGSGFVPAELTNFVGHGALVLLATDADPSGDACAERCREALLGAGHRMLARTRPDVPGRDEADLRDLIEHLEDDRDRVLQALVGAMTDVES